MMICYIFNDTEQLSILKVKNIEFDWEFENKVDFYSESSKFIDKDIFPIEPSWI